MRPPAPGQGNGSAACLRRSPGSRGFAGTRPSLRRSAGLVAGLGALLLGGGALAKEMRVGRCVVEIPNDWSFSGDRAASPDGVVTVQIREVSSGRVFVNVQRAFGMRLEFRRTVTRDLTVLRADAGRLMRYYGVEPSRSTRACVAQATSSSRARNGEAEGVAGSLDRQ